MHRWPNNAMPLRGLSTAHSVSDAPPPSIFPQLLFTFLVVMTDDHNCASEEENTAAGATERLNFRRALVRHMC